MSSPLVVVGAGGFGRETLDVVDAINAASASPVWNVLGVVDDAPSEVNLDRLSARGVAHLGAVDVMDAMSTVSYAVGVGAPDARSRLAAVADRAGHRAATLVHPSVTFGFGSVVGSGSVVCAGVTISTNVVIGRHVHLNPGTAVGHDVQIEDYVSVNPRVAVGGGTILETACLLGAGSVVLQGLRVGRGSVVGGSACVVRDVPADATVKGVPAR